MEHEDPFDLISAAFDGLRVDVHALKEALGTAEGRLALADLMLIRAAATADDCGASPGTEAALARRFAQPVAWWRLPGRRVPASVAAALVLVAALASYWIGVGRNSRPPELLTSTPAAVTRPAARQTGTDSNVTPPTPEKVLQFTNWSAGS